MRLFSFAFFALFWLSSPSQAQESNSFASDYAPIWERAQKYTLDVVKAMPENKYDYKPTPKIRTFREQIRHLVDNMAMLQTYVTGNKKSELHGLTKDFDKKSKKEVIATLNQGFNYIHQVIQELDDREAEEAVDFFANNVPMNKKKILYLIRNHVTHHRGQAIIYLRLNDIRPPRYIGW